MECSLGAAQRVACSFMFSQLRRLLSRIRAYVLEEDVGVTPIFIAVIGSDERLKSQFINLVSNSSQQLDAALITSCGGVAATSPFDVGGHSVVLLDTPDWREPGDESQICNVLREFLSVRTAGSSGSWTRELDVIYLQHLTERDLMGTMPEEFFRRQLYRSMAFVTTSWEEIGNMVGEQHEDVLEYLLEDVSQVDRQYRYLEWFRHDGTKPSGQHILQAILQSRLRMLSQARGKAPARYGRPTYRMREYQRRRRDKVEEPLSMEQLFQVLIRPVNPLRTGSTPMPGGWLDDEEVQPSLIAVMGATGSGKSTFINTASGSNFQTSGGLRACSAVVTQTRPFLIDGRKVILVDTPGFDDTEKSDADILKLIADFLSSSYRKGHKLTGLLFFHRISDFRMGGVSVKNFRMFRKLCGDKGLQNVVIVTNMWGEVTLEKGKQRESELAEHDDFFKAALSKGSSMIRHDNTRHSAHAILRRVLQNSPVVLEIQEDTVDRGIDISMTAAAAEMDREIKAAAERGEAEAELIKEEMQEISRIKAEKAALVREREAEKREEEMARIAAEQRRLKERMERERRELADKLEKQKQDRERERERRQKEQQARVKQELRWDEERRRQQREEEARLAREVEVALEKARRDEETCIMQ